MTLKKTVSAFLAGVLILLGAASSNAESKNLVVVELFTSQGCSSCPPADALLRDLSKMPEVLPLALHVDYWDYIGWADSFARPEHTKRQKSYAKVAGSRTIYTPQMVIGGKQQIVGARPMEVAEAIMRLSKMEPRVPLSISKHGDDILVSAPGGGRIEGPIVVQLIRYLPRATVRIERGENAGRTLDYVNIVTGWDRVAEWNGVDDLQMNVSAPGSDSAAIILQHRGHGEILAAARAD